MGCCYIQCNQCTYVCPHATIRPVLLTDEEAAAGSANFGAVPGKANLAGKYQFKMQVSPLDCQDLVAACVNICPGELLEMVPLGTQLDEALTGNNAVALPQKENPMDKYTVKGSQFEKPLLEFSGACAGCGETPYIKLVTQLFGDRMYVANATGCTSIWGGSAPSMPYTTTEKRSGSCMV